MEIRDDAGYNFALVLGWNAHRWRCYVSAQPVEAGPFYRSRRPVLATTGRLDRDHNRSFRAHWRDRLQLTTGSPPGDTLEGCFFDKLPGTYSNRSIQREIREFACRHAPRVFSGRNFAMYSSPSPGGIDLERLAGRNPRLGDRTGAGSVRPLPGGLVGLTYTHEPMADVQTRCL